MSLTVNTVLTATVTGTNGPGSIILSGAEVGDIVLAGIANDNEVGFGGLLESSISVAGEVQQTSGNNLTSATIQVWLFRSAGVSTC